MVVVVDTDVFFTNVDSSILHTVTVGFLLEIFFTFGPRVPFGETSAGEEDDPIGFSLPFRSRFEGLVSAGRLTWFFPWFFRFSPIATTFAHGAE